MIKGRARITGRNAAGKLRPHTWLTGPDEYKHQMYSPWQCMSAQARFRGEPWDLSFEDFYDIWQGHWDDRGRSSDDLCMTRADYELAWSKDNIILITRAEHCRHAAQENFRIHGRTRHRTRGMDKQKRKARE